MKVLLYFYYRVIEKLFFILKSKHYENSLFHQTVATSHHAMSDINPCHPGYNNYSMYYTNCLNSQLILAVRIKWMIFGHWKSAVEMIVVE